MPRDREVAGSLMREDLAIAAAAAGEVVLWGDQRLLTTLSFVYLAEREDEPVVRALREILGRVWTDLQPARTDQDHDGDHGQGERCGVISAGDAVG